MARALGRRQANGLWLTVLTGLCALLVAGVVVAVAPTNVAWLGVCAALFALLALVWPLAESRGEAVTETRDGGAVTAFTYLRWRAVRAFLPGAILMGAAAVLLSYAIVRRLVVGGSPDSTTTDAAFGIAGGVLIIALAVGYWILVARAAAAHPRAEPSRHSPERSGSRGAVAGRF